MSDTKELTYAEVAEHSSKKVSVISGGLVRDLICLPFPM